MEGSHHVFEFMEVVYAVSVEELAKLAINSYSRAHVETEKRLVTGCTKRQGKNTTYETYD